MSGKSLGFETWHFQFTLAFVLRPFLSAYSDDIPPPGIRIPFCHFWGLKIKIWACFQFWTSSQLLNLYFFLVLS